MHKCIDSSLSSQFYAAISKARGWHAGDLRGGTLRLKVCNDVGHSCWSKAVREEGLMDWLLRRRAKSIQAVRRSIAKKPSTSSVTELLATLSE